MSEPTTDVADLPADRYRRIAAPFTALVGELSGDDWERDAPCDEWVAHDIVDHLVEWIPGFFASAEGPPTEIATAVVDGASAAASWVAIDAALQAALDDPAVAGATLTHPMLGERRFDDVVMQIVAGDVLIHTWDLATSQGRDVVLDPATVTSMLAGMQAMGDAMRGGGMFGPEVEVPADADEQTRLIAFSGRQP